MPSAGYSFPKSVTGCPATVVSSHYSHEAHSRHCSGNGSSRELRGPQWHGRPAHERERRSASAGEQREPPGERDKRQRAWPSFFCNVRLTLCRPRDFEVIKRIEPKSAMCNARGTVPETVPGVAPWRGDLCNWPPLIPPLQITTPGRSSLLWLPRSAKKLPHTGSNRGPRSMLLITAPRASQLSHRASRDGLQQWCLKVAVPICQLKPLPNCQLSFHQTSQKE